MGAEAVTNFFDQMIYGISRVIIAIFLFLIPLVAAIILTKKHILTFEKVKVKTKLITAAGIVLSHAVCLLSLLVGGTEAYSAFDIYYDKGIGTDITIENLGIVTATRLELINILFPNLNSRNGLNIIGLTVDENGKPINSSEQVKENTPKKKEDRNPVFLSGEDIPVNVIKDPDPTPETHNMLDIDFEDLISHETNEDIVTLHRFFMSKQPTKKNEYTGYFKDYNLIALCAESFSPAFVTKELTPTLYKLTHEGFVFNNYYGSFESNTTNGEYSFCLGMFPDLSRDKTDNSFIASAKNYLPFALGQMFRKQCGSEPYAFHDYYGTYYRRNLTHPNMGYEFITPDSGLDMDVYWPSSDLEMMQASVDYYIKQDKPFLAYYMTFSGHYLYNWVNPMSARNRSSVRDLGFKSETVKAYIACNLELEKALTYLIEKLDEAEVLDKTVIVLTNDHYPYGLSKSDYDELSGADIDVNFGKYKNSFICWNSAMKDPVYIDDYCCTIDILPTLLNLFGLDFDSRLLMGVDVLSDSDHIAILANQSFITDEMRFSSNSNTVEYSDPKAEKDEDMLNKIKNYVKNVFTVSTAILNKNYYSKLDYVFGDDIDPDDYTPSDGPKIRIPVETDDLVPDTERLDDPVPDVNVKK